ncbi:MAG: hypothetical protein ACYC5H_01050 [Methylovirgula sp.]
MDPLPYEAPPLASGAAAEANEAGDALSAPTRLKRAIRKARFDEAERSDVIAELRGAETARLEMLQEELRPLLAEVPRDVDMFDMGLMPGEKSRLFIDMIGFVEMGRDRRTYRFVQDTRYGRVTIAESERMEPIVEAVTQYVARRLIEREKALAGDKTLEQAAAAFADVRKTAPKLQAIFAPEEAPLPSSRASLLRRGAAFVIEVLGAAVLFALVTIGGVNTWRFVSAWLDSLH